MHKNINIMFIKDREFFQFIFCNRLKNILYCLVRIYLRRVIYIYSKFKNNSKTQRSVIMFFALLLSKIIQFCLFKLRES